MNLIYLRKKDPILFDRIIDNLNIILNDWNEKIEEGSKDEFKLEENFIMSLLLNDLLIEFTKNNESIFKENKKLISKRFVDGKMDKFILSKNEKNAILKALSEDDKKLFNYYYFDGDKTLSIMHLNNNFEMPMKEAIFSLTSSELLDKMNELLLMLQESVSFKYSYSNLYIFYAISYLIKNKYFTEKIDYPLLDKYIDYLRGEDNKKMNKVEELYLQVFNSYAVAVYYHLDPYGNLLPIPELNKAEKAIVDYKNEILLQMESLKKHSIKDNISLQETFYLMALEFYFNVMDLLKILRNKKIPHYKRCYFLNEINTLVLDLEKTKNLEQKRRKLDYLTVAAKSI